MRWLAEHWVAVALFTCYMVLLFQNAREGLRQSDGVSGYFVGGRTMGGAVIGISFYATFASTNSYLGHAGKGYEYGAPWLVMAALLVVFAYVSWRVVAPKLRRFTADWQSVTLPDFLAVRFQSQRVRVASALVIVFASLLYLVAIFKGAGNLFQVFLGVPYVVAVGLTLLIVMAYTSVGGFISVVRTDVVQGVLMLAGAVVLFYYVTAAAGGVGAIGQLMSREDTRYLFDLNAGIPFVVLLGIALAGSLKLLVDPRQVSRFYGLRDERSIRVGIWVAVVGILVVQFALFPVGIYARLLLEGVTDTDLVVPTLVNDVHVVPRAVGDFLVVAILAAAMSSLDSVLLAAASVLSRDIAGVVRDLTEPQQIRVTRGSIVGLAAVAALVALRPPGGIVEITIFSGSLYAVCFVPTVLLGLHWRRGNETAALAAVTVGVSVLVAWLGLGLNAHLHEVFPALFASLVVYSAVARSTKSVEDPRVTRFFATRQGES